MLGALLLALAAWLMLSGEPPIPPDPRPIRLPFSMSAAESRRGEARRTVVPPRAPDAGLAPPRARDPLMAIMPPTLEGAALVAEFNAIVNSDIGQLMLECLFGDDSTLLAELRDAGVDPATGLDRVAFIDDAMVLTGDFRGEGWKSLLPPGPSVQDYGREGRLYTWQFGDGGTSRTMASWGGQMLLASPSEATAKKALDRLESSGPTSPGVMSEDEAYGEVYGMLSSDAIAELFEEEDPRLAATLREAAGSVRIHADVRHDLGLVADIEGADSSKTEELRRALGGALSVARMAAQAKGRPEEARLLDGARVNAAAGGSFRLQAGLPYEYMAKVFRECIERKRGVRASDGGLDGGGAQGERRN